MSILGSHVPRLAELPCKEIVEGSIPFGSTKNTIFKNVHYKNLTVMVGYRILIAQDVECLIGIVFNGQVTQMV